MSCRTFCSDTEQVPGQASRQHDVHVSVPGTVFIPEASVHSFLEFGENFCAEAAPKTDARSREGSDARGRTEVTNVSPSTITDAGTLERFSDPGPGDSLVCRVIGRAVLPDAGDDVKDEQAFVLPRTASLASFGKHEKVVMATVAKSTEEEEFCCICLEEYSAENPALYGACQHHFHLPCLMNWKQRSNVCPMCASESLRGVADDADPPPAPPASHFSGDDFLALLLQRQLGQLRDEGRHRHGERPRGRGRGPREWDAGRRQQTCEAANGQRPRHASGRGESGAGPQASSSGHNSAYSAKTSSGERHSRTGDASENKLLAFFSRVFWCCKK